MDPETFKIRSKQWINHKVILATKSDWYKQPRQKSAISNIKDRFGAFLTYPTSFSINHLALLMKRHEDLLLTIMPIPQNPGYEKAFNALAELLMVADKIVNENNLKHML